MCSKQGANKLFTILLTLVIEIPILFILEFRKKDIVIIGTLINIVTNYAVNVIMYQLKYVVAPEYYVCWIFPLEVSVVFIEFIVMSFFTDKKIKLFFTVLFANILSYFSGVLIFGTF